MLLNHGNDYDLVMPTKERLIQMRFGVVEHEVSVVTAVASLISIADILKEIGSSFGNEKVDVTITAPEPGSVLFYIAVVASQNIHQIIPGVIDSINFAKTLLDIFKIGEATKGERPRSITTQKAAGKTVTQITGQKGNTYIVNGDVHVAGNLLISNTTVQKSVRNLGDIGKKDEALNTLSFKYDSEEYAISKAAFDYLEKIGEDSDFQESIVSKAQLIIIRPSFDQKLKSDFCYEGARITCTIQDADFYKEIDGGKKFSKGDVLESNLIIKRKFDSSVNAYINHSYIVTKVTRHIPRSEQPTLGL
jgi:hypothetical protein